MTSVIHGTGRVADEDRNADRRHAVSEVLLLLLLAFVYGGDPPPMVNESHYLVKAKNFWDPQWCASDLLASSGKAHVTFYLVFGWLTKFVSLEATAWIGRLVGWGLLALGLQRLSWNLFHRHYLSLAIAVAWIAGIEYGNLAGEWVVGGIEAKVPAYGLTLLGLAEMVRRRWDRTWLLLGAASAFHVLTGGWSVVAASVAWWFTERGQADRRRFLSPALFAGGALAMLGLVPALALTFRAGPEGSVAAAKIYTYYRITHHLLPADLQANWYLRHGLLIVATGWGLTVYRHDPRICRLGAFTIGAIAIAVTGLMLGVLPTFYPDLAARLLRYYWFRLTDAAVPLMLGVILAKMLIGQSRYGRLVALMSLTIATCLLLQSSYRTSHLKVPPAVSNELLGFDQGASSEQQQQVYRDWLAVCRWAKESTDPDEVLLTPRHQQTFKWYAERGEVVNWKDVPQDSRSLIEWYRRFQEIFPQRLGYIRVTIQYSKLREYRKVYGVRWMIVDRRVCGDSLPLVRVYPTADEVNSNYAVYELPEP